MTYDRNLIFVHSNIPWSNWLKSFIKDSHYSNLNSSESRNLQKFIFWIFLNVYKQAKSLIWRVEMGKTLSFNNFLIVQKWQNLLTKTEFYSSFAYKENDRRLQALFSGRDTFPSRYMSVTKISFLNHWPRKKRFGSVSSLHDCILIWFETFALKCWSLLFNLISLKDYYEMRNCSPLFHQKYWHASVNLSSCQSDN